MSLFIHHSRARKAAHVLGPGEAVHDTHELNWVIDGSEWLALDGGKRRHDVAGAIAIIPAGVVHSSGTGPTGARYACLHVAADAAQSAVDELCPRLFTRPLGTRSTRSLRAAFEALRGVAPARAADTLGADTVTLALLRHLGEHVGLRRQRAVSGEHHSLARVDEALRENPEAAVSVTALARLAGLTPWHFVRAFRRAYGVTPHRRVVELRVAKAQALMRDAQRTLTDVAYEAGFGSSSRLSEAFRKHLRTTPSAYRASLA